jgi:putative zinc finger protein
MSVLTCAQVRELAPELALGVLAGAERAETITHVNGCARCQAYVSELTSAADALPLLTPEVEPPAGFEARVMRGIAAGRRGHRRRWIATVAAVAAAVAILSITTVRIVESGDTTPTASAPAQTGAPVSVAMKGAGGLGPAGWVYLTGRRSVAVAVDYGLESGTYEVRVTAPDGAVQSLGSMSVDAGRGSWTGRSVAPITNGSTIALVNAAGIEMCHGTVST